MSNLQTAWRRLGGVSLHLDRRGVTAVEYALIGAFIMVAIVAGVNGLGAKVTSMILAAAAAI